MPVSLLIGILAALSAAGFYLGRSRAFGVSGNRPSRLHSLPSYHGYYVAVWAALPAFLVILAWVALEGSILNLILVSALPPEQQALPANELGLLLNDVRNVARGDASSQGASAAIIAAAAYHNEISSIADWALTAVILGGVAAAVGFTRSRISTSLRARNNVERVAMTVMIVCSMIAILTTIGIILSLLFEAIRFFNKVPPADFLFGLEWSPQTAIRADQVGAEGAFGAIPLVAGTMLISFIAMCVAAPVGLLAAIYMAEYAPAGARSVIKPVLEILAGVPTVVYGFFAALIVAPFFRDIGIDINHFLTDFTATRYEALLYLHDLAAQGKIRAGQMSEQMRQVLAAAAEISRGLLPQNVAGLDGEALKNGVRIMADTMQSHAMVDLLSAGVAEVARYAPLTEAQQALLAEKGLSLTDPTKQAPFEAARELGAAGLPLSQFSGAERLGEISDLFESLVDDHAALVEPFGYSRPALADLFIALFGNSAHLFAIASESALAAGVVMGVMIIPFVSSLSDDVISAVPQSLREGAYGLGATKSETIKQVILPAALPGIVGSLLLAVSRAIGETMIVVMAAGLSANLTVNPIEAVTTVTVQIVTLLVGDQEFDSAKTLASFALGLLLFFITLVLNVIALWIVNKYREQYD